MPGVGTSDDTYPGSIEPGSPEAIAGAERGQRAADDLVRIRISATSRRHDVLSRQQAAVAALGMSEVRRSLLDRLLGRGR
jgi:hypothetical protein